MSEDPVVEKEGVRIIRGTPTSPLQRPTLFLRVWRVAPSEGTNGPPRSYAALTMARPGGEGYIVKDLMSDMELAPKEAVDKAVAIARRGDVGEIYVNADMSKLPGGPFAATG